MQPLTNAPLSSHSTMRLGGTAAYLTTATSPNELVAALQWAESQHVPVIMIGGGSNIVWRDAGYTGLVIVNAIKRYEDFDEDGVNHYLTVGAGEVWDEVVNRAVAAELSGIEALSLIPGTAGATPVQNVGAYGQEIASTLVSVEAYDRQTKQFVNIRNADCAFGYRTSRFKSADKGRFFITSITLHLTKANPQPPFYASVQSYFETHAVSEVTPQALRGAVVAIRSAKLPDPAKVANNGSFFANPIVNTGSFTQLVAMHGDMPHWSIDDHHVKLSAAWLIEHAGFSDYHDPATGMATWPGQALVIINEHAQHTADLMAFTARIVTAVKVKFGITLEHEPELLP